MYRARTIFLILLLLICAQLIIPPLTGMWSFALLWVWLAGALVVFGADSRTLIFGILGALAAELIGGIPMGSTAAGFLVAAVLYASASRFISLRPLFGQYDREWTTVLLAIVVGLVLVGIIASVAIAFEALVYGHTAVWRQMMLSWYVPQVLLSLGLQLLVAIVLFRRIALTEIQRRNTSL